MENSNLIIRIAEPCHEDWTKMQPDAKGKFCGSCSKSVFDFSNKTDAEIHTILLQHKDEQVCGHFKKTQVNRPLNISIDLNNLPKNMSSTKTFAVALLLVFGTFLFSCTDMRGQKVETIEVINNTPEKYELGALVTPLQREDTVPAIKSLPIECYISEVHVAGGVSYENIIPNIDSIIPIKEVPVTEQVMGLMMVVLPEEKDTTTADPISNIDGSRFLDQPINDTKQTDLIVYPNPSNGEFNIKYDVLKRADIRVDILDLKGALIKTIVDINGQFEGKYNIPVNVSELPNGIYIVSLINNGKHFTEKLVIGK